MNSGGTAPVSGKTRVAEVSSVLARWLLGGLFLYMGLNKALHPIEFLKLVRQYDVLHHHLFLNFVASTLPWFEIFCGLLLLLGVAVRGAAAMLVAMLIPFTVAVLLRALEIHGAGGLPFCAIKFDCGCGAGEVFICRKLAENVLLTGLSSALIFWRSHRLCLRHSFFATVPASAQV
jgi:uncharacterized membrane protein YphA (DoxX/SURF4 family)